MSEDQITIGTRVRSNIEFSGVPKGTEGVVVEDYGTGVMVEWKFTDPDRETLRDGFDKLRDLQYLDVI